LVGILTATICHHLPVRSSGPRATAYGFLNTVGICSGALITDYLGKSTMRNLAGEFSKWRGGGDCCVVQLVSRPEAN
jgi:hypothetical protein